MNDKAMWELAKFLKAANEGSNCDAPDWLTASKGLPVEDYAQDLCRALQIGLFAISNAAQA